MVDEDMNVKENVKLDEESPRTHMFSCKLCEIVDWDSLGFECSESAENDKAKRKMIKYHW